MSETTNTYYAIRPPTMTTHHNAMPLLTVVFDYEWPARPSFLRRLIHRARALFRRPSHD